LELSLDSLRGRPVYLARNGRDCGFLDDVIIDPQFGVVAFVSHHSRGGTWAFPYMQTQIAADAIIVAERGKQAPGVFLRQGRSYQEMLGGKVLGPDGSMLGRIKAIELIDVRTGEIAYRVSPPGVRELWMPAFSVHAPTQVIAADNQTIVLRTSAPGTGLGDEARFVLEG
jgi:uncharacterized protein YrrD